MTRGAEVAGKVNSKSRGQSRRYASSKLHVAECYIQDARRSIGDLTRLPRRRARQMFKTLSTPNEIGFNLK